MLTRNELVKRLGIMGVALFGMTTATATDGWRGPGQITFVQPEIYQQTNEGGHPIFVGTTIPNPNCTGSTWVIRSDMDDGNRIYASVLAAFAAGKNVELYQWSCIQVGSTFYSRIGAVKVLP